MFCFFNGGSDRVNGVAGSVTRTISCFGRCAALKPSTAEHVSRSPMHRIVVPGFLRDWSNHFAVDNDGQSTRYGPFRCSSHGLFGWCGVLQLLSFSGVRFSFGRHLTARAISPSFLHHTWMWRSRFNGRIHCGQALLHPVRFGP